MGKTGTKVLRPDAAGLDVAANLLRRGGLVAFPTETVYGLGADATNARAVAGIFAAKDRPRFNPLIVHVPDLDAARALAEVSDDAARVASAFWPGPLSMVLPVRPGAPLADLATAGLPTVALRMPAHPVAQALLRAAVVPIAAPSANPSGRISPTRADHVLEGLEGRIDAVLDGGPCEVGIESTILSVGPPATILRPGAIGADALSDCLGRPVGFADPARDGVVAPGQLASHYAPAAGVRLDVRQPGAGEAFLGFGALTGDLNLSPTGDLREAAANLFAHLRALDARGVSGIAVAPIPETGLGLAINDRLRRAAAPRGSSAPGGG